MIDEREAYKAALGHKVLDAISDVNVKQSMSLQFSSDNDGYAMLYHIMKFHVPSLTAPASMTAYANATARPKHPPNGNVFAFQARLMIFIQSERNYGRIFTPVEQAQIFIAGLKGDSRFDTAVEEAEKKCPQDVNAPVPIAYSLGMIAATMGAFAHSAIGVDFDVFDTTTGTTAQINAAHATTTDSRRPERRKPRKRPPPPEVQCAACKGYGHTMTACFHFLKVYWCLKAIDEDPAMAKTIALAFQDKMSVARQSTARASVHRAFVAATGATGDPDAYSDDLRDRFDLFQDQYCPHLEDFAQINSLRCTVDAVTSPDISVTTDIVHDDDIADLNPQALQAVCLPPTPAFITADHEMESLCAPAYQSQPPAPTITTPTICHLEAPIALQSDPGANRHITSDLSLLDDFQLITPFDIGTIQDGAAVQVTGQGILNIPASDGTERPIAYYSANASGSVFSPDHYVAHHDHYHSWTQHGCPSTGDGSIIFYNIHGTEVSRIMLYPRNGLWFMKVNKPVTVGTA